MANQPWHIAGPLPSDTPEDEAAFRAAVRRIYTNVDDTEALVPDVEALLERLDRHSHSSLWAHVQRCLATRSAILGAYDVAEPRINAALSLVDVHSSPREYFNLLNLRGLIYKFRGNYAKSVETHAAVLQTARDNDLLTYGMVSITNLAYALMEMGNPKLANERLVQGADLLDHTTPSGTEQYWTARLTCAEALQDRQRTREAYTVLSDIQARNASDGLANDPSGIAAIRALGPLARLPDQPSTEELVEAGVELFDAVIRETLFMPGYRLKAAVDCARVALKLEQADLALQLVDFGRSIRPDELPVQWATQLEDIAARVHEVRGDYQQALVAERNARTLERGQHIISIESGTAALVERATDHSPRLRALELEQVNDALRSTTHRMQAALAAADEARGRAEEAVDARHRFLSRMSHELRTPLQGVLGAIELFHDTPINREQRELLGMLGRSARLTLGIINDILDVARLEEGRIEIDCKPFMLQSVIDDTISQVRMRAVEQNTSIEVFVHPSLPRVVLGDRRRITQVLLNLVGNAVKFTTDGTVHLRVGPANKAIEFTVRDTGCGIAPDDLDTIFDPYIRAPRSHHTETEGAGLGLAIAHRLVKAMNGTLSAQSRPQIGSTFTMELELPAAAPAPDLWSADRPATGPSLSGVRVLLAEDNSVSQMVLQRHLKMLGGQVEVVETGPEALARVLESPFDVVILDFHMPGLSGLEVSRQLRRAGYDIPIIGLTASALPEDEAAARAAHMDAYATKPISRTQLQKLVHGTVEARRA